MCHLAMEKKKICSFKVVGGCLSKKKKKKKKNDREGQLVSEIAIIPDWLSRDVQRYLLPG